MNKLAFFVLSFGCLHATLVRAGAGGGDAEAVGRYENRWVWVPANLMVDKEADRVVALINRAGKAGYNGIVLNDYKFNFLDRMPQHYFAHAKEVREAAEKANVEIIPAVFPIGYSNGLLSNDVNLAEGLPVVSAPYVVKGREAVLKPDSSAKLGNGDLEETKGDVFVKFGYQDKPGTSTFADRSVAHHGQVSCRMENFAASPVCRLIQTVKTRPHACYRLSCWVKTRDFERTGEFRLLALGEAGGRALTFHEGGVKSTQDWSKVEVVFNSLDQMSVNLYVGTWGGKTGTLWIDEVAIDELSFVNILRRDGCPLIVASDDGKTIYTEGRDFEPLVDPKLGQVPYLGEFEAQHVGPALQIKPDSRIKNGQRLRVSWYHPVLTLGTYVACCLSEPKIYDLLRDQAKRVNDVFHPKTFFMQHDEMRVANWCAACAKRKLTAGELLANNAKRCTSILKDVSPSARVLVWSDMFDPNHNAVANYYLVNGTLEGSWKGLDSSVIIANWNAGKAKESLSFFAARGHSQLLAGYYDSDDNFAIWDAAAKGTPKIYGFMYTTWQNNFENLEKYGKMMENAR